MNSGLYQITHKDTGRIYIGQSSNLTKRLRAYKNCGGSGNGNSVIKRAILKYGWEEFDAQILVYCINKDYINDLEIKCIAAYGSLVPNGFNVHIGGKIDGFTASSLKKALSTNKNRIITDEYRKSQSIICKEKWATASKEKIDKYREIARNLNLGKKLSAAHKQKISETRIKRIADGTIVYHKHIIKRKLSEEHKKKVGEASKRIWQDPEYRAKMAIANSIAAKKRWANPEYRTKVLAAMRGKS